jgi:arylsulfatase A-like enzyme
MLVSMDNGIGRIIQALKDNGVYEHTLVIFLSDNGAPKDSAASSAPLRGNKSDTYEGGIRVPFVMSWPNGLPAGQTYKLPVSSLDLAPTITALAGAPAPAQGYDGVDLMPYLCGEKKGRPHEIMYWRRDSDYAIRVEDWKLAWNDGRPNGTRTSELFNLADDPNEKTDLIKQYPEKATNLQKMFDDWDSKLPDNEWWGGPANRKR